MIQVGSKTETRRLGKKRWNEGSVHEAKTKLFGKPFAKLRILRVFRQPLGQMTRSDAKKEGYRTLQDYITVFRTINGFWEPSQSVWVVQFKVEK
jgi:hypothetical protein